jgi:hypothetical protein
MLDFDECTRASLLRFIQRNWWFPFQFYWTFGRLAVKTVDVRETSDGYHIRIRVKNTIPSLDLNFLQAILGSDPKRECFGHRRLAEIRTMRVWNVLYAYKFDSHGNFTMHEKTDTRLAKRIAALIKGFQTPTKPLRLADPSAAEGSEQSRKSHRVRKRRSH